MCGGTHYLPEGEDSGGGLSPRVRGNRVEAAGGVTHAGSIPACAGEPVVDTTGDKVFRVYPRVCGGTHVGWLVLQGRRGLSPRVRGNQP